MKPLIKEIIKSLENSPSDWSLDLYGHLQYGSELKIHIGGLVMTDIISPFRLDLSVAERFVLLRRINSWKRKKLSELLQKGGRE